MGDNAQPRDSAGGCILHLFWTLLGPGFLLVLGLFLFANRPAVGSAFDLVFAGSVLALIVARLLDPTRGSASTQGGTDVARTSRLKYVVGVLAVAGLIYGLARFVVPKVFP